MKKMKMLLRKEFISIVCSATGLVFALLFLSACGLMLWLFEGSFNILDGAYATLDKFFTLSSYLFVVLIPALTMRSVSEEKRSGTYLLLCSRPISASAIWFSKWFSVFSFLTLVIASTLVYLYTLFVLGNPVGNIDIQATIVSYISLILLAGIFTAVGVFTSSLTSNQVVAFIGALFLNFVLFFGFDLLSKVFSSGSLQNFVSSCGLNYHFTQMQRGVIEYVDIAVFALYFIIIRLATIYLLTTNKRLSKIEIIVDSILIIVITISIFIFSTLRLDFTKDQRYTLSVYSRELMKELKEDDNIRIDIRVFLEGNLNAGFERLRSTLSDLLIDLNKLAGYRLNVSFINPISLSLPTDQLSKYMSDRGMPSIILNEVNREGKVSRQLIYPYAQVISDADTLLIPLLKNVEGYTAEQNLKASAEDLEFQLVDALRLLIHNEEKNIAFVEGHGELSRAYVYDAEEILSKYFNINRGQIGDDISVLDGFKVIIIAGAKEKFTEGEKYVLDQYLMKGGSILWLLDGALVSSDDLAKQGYSASIKNETNLDDLLFSYGIRIRPVFVQDSHSSSILVNSGENSSSITIPWYFSPILLPSANNIITKGVAEVKSEFVSPIDLLEGSKHLDRNILLTTAAHSHLITVPEKIDLDIEKIQNDPDYFSDSFQPVAISLEGSFKSAFLNRPIPANVVTGDATKNEGVKARMIVVSSSSIIKNDVVGQGSDSHILPMGLDRVSNRLYGNRNFIINAVNWLADDSDKMSLRSKNQTLSLLDKQKIYTDRNFYIYLNLVFPLFFVIACIAIIYVLRKYKYSK